MTVNLSKHHRGLATVILALAATGAGIGVHLTRLKFRQLAFHCLELSAGCRLTERLDCADALASPWSQVLGLPLSLWATAFYAVVMALAGTWLWRPHALGGATPHILLGLAIADLGMSLVLFIYSTAYLGTFCPFCLSLYAISMFLVLAAVFGIRAHRLAGGERLRDAWRRPNVRLNALFLTSMVFIYTAGVQSVVFQRTLAAADSQTGCPKVSRLPETALVFGAAEPELILALFVDLTCPYCQREYTAVAELFRDDALGATTQVRVYHMPRAACSTSAFPGGFPGWSSQARSDDACLAAIAIECAEMHERGKGIALLSQLYALHELPADGQTMFTIDKVVASARAAGLGDEATAAAGALLGCINGGDAASRVSAHQRYVIDELWRDTHVDRQRLPILMLLPVRNGKFDVDSAWYLGQNAGKREITLQIEEMRKTDRSKRG